MNLNDFLKLSRADVAHLVRESGNKVCVFPINGTRRWFSLEYGDKESDDPLKAYMDLASQNHIGLYQLFFEHGIDTLLTPVFGAELFGRGDEYVQQIGMTGVARLATHPDFIDFYDSYQVRVRFYGDYMLHLQNTPYAEVLEQMSAITERTKKYHQHRLFFGVFANNATNAVARLAVQYYQEHHIIPDEQKIIELYYGEKVSPVDFFIGFDKFSAFDYPLLANGEEDLYFTIAPSPYMDDIQLRKILFDHLYTRQVPDPDYASISSTEWQQIRDFYSENSHRVLGVGSLYAGIWVPEHSNFLKTREENRGD